MSWVVHKFGGSSLADAEAFRHVGGLLDSLDDRRQAVVVSAMQGTTDALIELARAAAGEATHSAPEWEAGFDDLRRRHLECAEALQAEDDVRTALEDAPVGEAIFRPSTKGSDFLTLSFKGLKNQVVHMVVVEKEKPNATALGRRLSGQAEGLT